MHIPVPVVPVSGVSQTISISATRIDTENNTIGVVCA